jgi:hypothetical protein
MGCNKCKKKDRMLEMERSTKFVSNAIVVFTIIWSMLGIYGLYSLIKLFL